ncbi:DUF565 domain-containing protein [Leptothoe spongobia]|uniref:DUF565 domain-containing protein n=1 Tax=Leptothoe spongobia TAU-MAC 1115 TaxID=1967444 RepID=A0A947DDB8_9CYAN|nr:DUF565 domain-containing protein [Leptothoe spongobia]MBT9313821.1 DUF565 domain-containing protein [Leptothoe spongobia TAU-MAC 1115]
MQRTRLSTLVEQAGQRFSQWIFNPWRRISLAVISLLFGNFFATAIAATAGQTAEIDILISAILVAMVELISWLYHRSRTRDQRTVLPEILNSFKLGMVYGLFVEAFKLGS